MDAGVSEEALLKSVLGRIAHRRPDRTARPARLKRQKDEAWLRTDAYLQYESGDFGDDPRRIQSTLRAFENFCTQSGSYDDEEEEDPMSDADDVRQVPSSWCLSLLTNQPNHEADYTT